MRIKCKEVVNLNGSKIAVLLTLLLVVFITNGCGEKVDKKNKSELTTTQTKSSHNSTQTQTVKEAVAVKQAETTVNGKQEVLPETASVQAKLEPSVPVKKMESAPSKKEPLASTKKEQPVIKKTEPSAPIKKVQTTPSKGAPTTIEIMPSEHYIDGTYIGEGQGKKGPIKVEVTIKNHRIAQIQVKEHGESEGIAEMAFNTVKGFILEQQTVSVEAMSGATKSSQGFKDAVEAALLLSIEVKE